MKKQAEVIGYVTELIRRGNSNYDWEFVITKKTWHTGRFGGQTHSEIICRGMGYQNTYAAMDEAKHFIANEVHGPEEKKVN